MALGELVDQYIAERVARGEFNGDTPNVARSILMHFARHVAEVDLGDLTRRHVELWIADPNLKASTRHSMIGKVKPFVRWLVEGDHVPKDFVATMQAPKVPPGMPRHLEGDQVRRLVRQARTSRDRLIVLIMVHLGLRRIEVSRIDMEDISFSERLLSVRGKNGQGQITRSLPITDEVWAALHAYLGEYPTATGPLIRITGTTKRMTPRGVGVMVARLMVECGIKKLPHDGISGHALRHTCAQELIDSQVNIRLVQKVLGHKSVATTEQYLRRNPPGLRDALSGRTYT